MRKHRRPYYGTEGLGTAGYRWAPQRAPFPPWSRRSGFGFAQTIPLRHSSVRSADNSAALPQLQLYRPCRCVCRRSRTQHVERLVQVSETDRLCNRAIAWEAAERNTITGKVMVGFSVVTKQGCDRRHLIGLEVDRSRCVRANRHSRPLRRPRFE